MRAKRPPNEVELKAIIKDTVDTCMAAGQLGDTPLTLQNLTTIMDSFAATLKGIYHPRVEYPSLDVPTEPVPTKSLEESDPGEQARSLDESLFSKTQPTLLPPDDVG